LVFSFQPKYKMLAKPLHWQSEVGDGPVPRMSPAHAPRALGEKIYRGREIAAEVSERHGNHHNDEQDALRHAEWSKQMADELGPGFSTLAGLQHEIKDLIPRFRFEGRWRVGPFRGPHIRVATKQPFAEGIMDMRNNAEGIAASVQDRPIDRSRLQVSPTRPSHDYERMRPPYPPR
jgi:hypothetical protein